ncbi:hypothetical protein [Maritimibacter sp. HL-12]|uniref:hypothetical protein n=1 Tax=Maritimibacter sp. HL-12 TaxID=1162418 RepID=UPI000A0F2320|nr:hypothetical protein [Maritimibacter sp. HL-12]SMH56666.1 hypothetical protein SAMN05661107_3290 [Maritimibacter sp. HL-12]
MFKKDSLDRFFSKLEWQWSLANLLWGAGAIAFTALPAWAVRTVGIMSEYAPLSWVLSGMAGFMIFVLGFYVYSIARGRVVRARYDNRALAKGGSANPMDKVFERKRIYINEFILPSSPALFDKTFVDCELIGPANIFLSFGNRLDDLVLPRSDAIAIRDGVSVFNMYQLGGCTFRRCSFQRITFFVSEAEYAHFKGSEMLNWISFVPDSEFPLLKTDEPKAITGEGQTPQQHQEPEEEKPR